MRGIVCVCVCVCVWYDLWLPVMQFNHEVRVMELDYYIMHLNGLRKTMLMLSHATLAMFLSVALCK